MNELTVPAREDFNLLSRPARRDAILRLQEALQQLQPQGLATTVQGDLGCVVIDHYAPGAYAREFLAPAGCVLIGKIHRHAHVNVLSMGRCLVYTEDGCVDLEAPCTFVSTPGSKRVVLTLTEIAWTTVHPTDKQSLVEIERDVIAANYEQLTTEALEAA